MSTEVTVKEAILQQFEEKVETHFPRKPLEQASASGSLFEAEKPTPTPDMKFKSTRSHLEDVLAHVQKMRAGEADQDLRTLNYFINEKIKAL